MPFVTVASKGGPHDDAAYVAGWVCGALDAQLPMLATMRGTCSVWVTPDVTAQLDLIAMRHHYLAVVGGPDASGQWVEVTFEPAPCSHGDG